MADEDDFFRRRRRRAFEDIFDSEFFEFDEEFRKMQEHMARLFEEALKAESGKEPKSFVYGVSMKTGPDGKPIIEEFGNVPKKDKRTADLDEIEPLVDVFDEENEVKVVAEIPGVEKEDINIDASPMEVTLKVDTQKKKYFKEIQLPAEVKTDEHKATYKNGILEITFKKVDRKKSSKTKIQVK